MIVIEISWAAMFDGQPLPDSPARTAWRAAVADPDFPTAPAGWCKPRISAAIAKRADVLAKQKLAQPGDGTSNEAPRPPPSCRRRSPG